MILFFPFNRLSSDFYVKDLDLIAMNISKDATLILNVAALTNVYLETESLISTKQSSSTTT